MSSLPILVSGGAGYIGSHAAFALKQEGYEPVVIDNLSTGNAWAASFGAFEEGDIGDADFVRDVCDRYKPAAAMHFAAFIEVGESVQNPAKYFDNNRDKAARFFKTLNGCGVRKIVFSSTAAVYGEVKNPAPISELQLTRPINPYGQSKLEAEAYLRMMDAAGTRSASLRYFNVAGAASAQAQIGEAHMPESHLIPRLILPLIQTPPDILAALGLANGFTIYGNDYPTPDGTAIRDYIHVMDLAAAHIRALDYLLKGGETSVFNLGSGKGFSVAEIVEAARRVLNKPTFAPPAAPRRDGDPAILIASSEKAAKILGWKPTHSLTDIIRDAVNWHCSPRYRDAIQAKLGKTGRRAV
ncbi:MAG: UDP-glucose 4-epimerase GalE [Alphaproteobacteria bacterium]|nr:UDP-glucose 4-epimerase GalE [Alphaproteobacteria bacterium]